MDEDKCLLKPQQLPLVFHSEWVLSVQVFHWSKGNMSEVLFMVICHTQQMLYMCIFCVLLQDVCVCSIPLTAKIFCPCLSHTQGHQPLTVFCSNRDTSLSWGWESNSRPHFSGDFAGFSMWFRSISKQPERDSDKEKEMLCCTCFLFFSNYSLMRKGFWQFYTLPP